jgi:predicted kinase
VTRIALAGRTLLLVAGIPGAGKSTLLAGLTAAPGPVALDSEAYRARMRSALPGVPYAWYRPLVHLWHRIAVLLAALSDEPTLVVHLPATDERTRAAVARLAASTGRSAHLLWLHADPAEARQGQHDRGRVVPAASFAAHAEQAATTTAALLGGPPPPGWSTVTVLDRRAARAGLRLDTETDTRTDAGAATLPRAPADRAITR